MLIPGARGGERFTLVLDMPRIYSDVVVFTSQRLRKDLHGTAQARYQMEGRLAMWRHNDSCNDWLPLPHISIARS